MSAHTHHPAQSSTSSGARTQIIAEPGVPQIIILRTFDASPALLFRAFTEPELLVQWLGPRDLITTLERFDVHDGGRWRYTQQDGAGNLYSFHGVFHGTPSPVAGIVQTFEFEGVPGHVALQTTTFEERDDKTLVRTNDVFQSAEDRDAMIESGMERGVLDSHARLDELLARISAAR